MALSAGSRVGPYEVSVLLGRGGMGEVWRASDPRLKRDVAIKALPTEFARDPERLARFDREARLLAAINHPNVAAILGVEEQAGARFLILEFVEGQTLAERLAAEPLSVDDALAIAAQVAAGLEAAHDAGVIHRDLKPENVKIRRDGTVKVLDLGLAKAIAAERDPAATSEAATVTQDTRAGTILGTAPYMSPEQVSGKPLDRRTDVFSFGCVLYECLTRRRAFQAGSVQETLAAILTREPEWARLPHETPGRVVALLHRCLRKDPQDRLRDIRDVRLEIEDARRGEAPVAPAPRTEAPPRWRALGWAGALAGLVVGCLATLAVLRVSRAPTASQPALRAVLPLPEGVSLNLGDNRNAVALSPDGRTAVFSGRHEGTHRLYRRALDGWSAEPIEGSEGASGPFFSPDGEWVGFFASDELRKIPLGGGAPIPLCVASPVAGGADWAPDGSIVFSRANNQGLFRCDPASRTSVPLTELDAARGEHAHLWPQVLPRGKGILATVVLGHDFADYGKAQVVVFEPGGRRRPVVEGADLARYAPEGWVLFVRGQAVHAIPFDLDRLEVTGPPRPLGEPVTVNAYFGSAHFAVGAAGTLLYVGGPPVEASQRSIVSRSRSGTGSALPLAPDVYYHPARSPDGRYVAITRCEVGSCKLYLLDRSRAVLSQLTPEPGRFFSPVWSPDGSRLAFSWYVHNDPRLAYKVVDGSGEIRTLTTGVDGADIANSWSPDGRVLAFTRQYARTDDSANRGDSDIWLMPLAGDGQASPWFESPYGEAAARFSPDGHWLAYVSDESGRREVYVRPFPGPGGKLKVSSAGGTEPLWTRGGREIVYRSARAFLAVDFRPGPEPSAGTARVLFEERLFAGGDVDWPWEYDVAPDGDEFIAMRTETTDTHVRQLTVVTRWTVKLASAEFASQP